MIFLLIHLLLCSIQDTNYLNISLKPNEIESYAIELKRALQDEISNDDYLLIGHCQAYYQNDQAKVATIKEFSPDMHRNGYAVLSLTQEGFNLNIVGK